MDGKATLPLPPGMVPSDSREDMSALNLDSEETEQNGHSPILKEGTLSSEKVIANVTQMESSSDVAWPGRTLRAWDSPDDDLEKESHATGMASIPAKSASPFISTSTPCSQVGQKSAPQKSIQHNQATPKRVMSPLKRFNRVAPSSGKATPLERRTLELKTEQDDTPLKSSSASRLEKNAESLAKSGKDRPDSAPLRGESVSKQVPIDVRVIIKSNEQQDTQSLAAEGNIPIYSTVVKKKVQNKPSDREAKKNAPSNPSIITVMPTLDTYQCSSLDTSIVFSNRETASPEPLHTSQVMECDYTTTPDPLYSTVEEVDASGPSAPGVEMAAYNPALLKQLKKHDNKGTVQLVSIKGMAAISNSETMSFPQGSSANMQPLHYAAACGDRKALAENISALPISQDTVEMLLGTEKLVRRDGIDIVDSEGRTPLMHAVHNNQLQAVKMLAESGANINMSATDGSTPLHQVAFSGSVEMVALLLSLGADGLMRDFEGRTPLHWCTNNPNLKCIEILLDKVPGLDVNIRDGALMTALMWAAFHGRIEQLRVLIEKGADPAIGDMDGMTAVHWSVQKHDIRALQVLINSESAQYVDKKGKTVMHQAAEQGSAKAASLIKAVRPSSVNDLDENGRTPLHWATVCENPEVMRALIHHGSDLSLRDFSGKTALDYATEKGKHYCGLILTKAEVLESTDSYHSILTYGSSSATVGFRALNHQEGQLLSPEQIKKNLSEEQILHIQTVCTGAWIYKFTNNGKGPLHPRYFWVNPSNTKICWARAKDANDRNTKSEALIGTRSSASPAIYGRKDFDPIDKHKYAFTIFTTNRVLDAVAVSSEDYKLWLNGLQLLLHFGSINVTRLMSAIQKASGGEPRPIP